MTRAAITQCHLLPLPGSCLRSPTGAAWSPLPGVGGFSRAGPCPATALPAPHPGTHRWRHRKGRRSQGSPTRLRDVGPWAQGGQPGGRGGGSPRPASHPRSAPLRPLPAGCCCRRARAACSPRARRGAWGGGHAGQGPGRGEPRAPSRGSRHPTYAAGGPRPAPVRPGHAPCPGEGPWPRPEPRLAPPSDVTQVVSPPSPRRPSRPSPPAAAPRPAAQSPAGEGRGGRAPANGERINTSSGGGARRASESTGVPAAQ